MIFPVYTYNKIALLNICCVTACFYEKNKKSCRYDFKKMKELILIKAVESWRKKTKIQGNSTVKFTTIPIFNKNLISSWMIVAPRY